MLLIVTVAGRLIGVMLDDAADAVCRWQYEAVNLEVVSEEVLIQKVSLVQ